MMTKDYENLLLKTISDMRQDMQNGFDKMYSIYTEHAKDDIDRFTLVDKQINQIALDTATAKGIAEGKTKVWATVATGAGAILGIAGTWFLKKIGL